MNTADLIYTPLVRAYMLLPSPIRKRLMQPLVPRFVAGETIKDVLKKAKELNSLGYKVTVDYFGGEHLDTIADIRFNFTEYMNLIELLPGNSEIAVKLSALGLYWHERNPWHPRYLEDFETLLQKAQAKNIFVWLDAEEREFRARMINIVYQFRHYSNIGYCIQVYADDFEEFFNGLLKKGLRLPIRICNGAYLKSDKKQIVKNPGIWKQRIIDYTQIALHEGFPRIQVATSREEIHRKINIIKDRWPDKKIESGVILGKHEAPYIIEMQAMNHIFNAYVGYGPKYQPFMERRLIENPSYLLHVFKK